MQKYEHLNFLDCNTNVFWAKKNNPSHFNWNYIYLPYLIEPNTHITKFNLALNMLLRLEAVVRGAKLSVNLSLNVIEVHFRFTGTHFDHNRNIINIFIFCLFPFVPIGLCTSFGPPQQGGCCDLIQLFWHPWHHTILIHN